MDQIALNVKMDLHNKVTSLESVLMINPFTKKSHRVARSVASAYNIDDEIYTETSVPKENVNEFLICHTILERFIDKNEERSEKKAVQVPKVIFLPNREVMRVMILGVVKFGKKDRLEQFLLRFGLMEDQQWHVNEYRRLKKQ
jgi:hypothetical protein